ncbi:hypothetical protein OUZ56_008349 [Daphnia magna]|uniref:Uncharacterized protein n=1 Tax=Daphnia magna TaxID=35525 RepID=A0ABR0ACP2_9CRUS|nr:hypothetical protein OUZ56_008349 [Daphnia magna]
MYTCLLYEPFYPITMSDLSSAHPGSPEGSFRNFSDRHFLAHESEIACHANMLIVFLRGPRPELSLQLQLT